MKSFELRYGQKKIGLNLDEGSVLSTLSPKRFNPLIDPKRKIESVLRYPISSKSFPELFNEGETVSIIVSDRTRNVAASVFLPVIMDELNSVGIPDNKITIVFACGTHRLHTSEEHIKVVGEAVAKRVKMLDHDCSDEKNLVNIGTTSRGTPVIINKLVKDSDKVILTGAITYHYFAGYGGGRKAVLPGISAFESIQTNHKLCLGEPKAATGVLDGNPIHEDMLEAARMLNPAMIFNVIMDDMGRLAAVFAGELNAAHVAGCEALDDNCRIELEKKADLVIASAGGGTKDMNFVQAHKAIEMASYALNDGGTMVMIAEADEEFPTADYMKYVNMGSAKAVEDELKKDFTIPGQTVFSMFRKAERFRIIWLTKVSPYIVKRIGIIPASNLAEAMNQVKDIKPCYIMPDAYNTYPVIRK